MKFSDSNIPICKLVELPMLIRRIFHQEVGNFRLNAIYCEEIVERFYLADKGNKPLLHGLQLLQDFAVVRSRIFGMSFSLGWMARLTSQI